MKKTYIIICPSCQGELEIEHVRTIVTPATPAEIDEEILVRKSTQTRLI